MKISSKLLIIVILTCFEISLTLWSVFEIAKAAKFHQLNFLHLKYNAEFSNQVNSLEKAKTVDVVKLKNAINNIKQQPTDCLNQVNLFNRFIMRQIGTAYALVICEEDIQDANKALASLDKFVRGEINQESLVIALNVYSLAFQKHSTLFEEPIAQTVSFIMRSIVPLVVFISLFNILFITLMSRNIKGSINGVIKLLSKTSNKDSLEADINKNVSGELKTLLEVAKKRVTDELMVKEINQKLEALVEKRTSSLTRANEELAQFAYRASHDLKAPLTSTKLLARFIKQDIQQGNLQNAADDAEKISSQMAKLEELVIGILALTEADSVEQGIIEIDFTSILSDIRTTASGLLTDSGCVFEQEISIDKPMLGEKFRLIQVIENLVTNAIKYHDPRKEAPFVKTSIYEKEESYTITVQDNGLGIPENRQGEVFQMFKRFHPTISFGSGLGMAIVKKHVDYMLGTIEMSTSDLGTTFTIVFPKEKIA